MNRNVQLLDCIIIFQIFLKVKHLVKKDDSFAFEIFLYFSYFIINLDNHTVSHIDKAVISLSGRWLFAIIYWDRIVRFKGRCTLILGFIVNSKSERRYLLSYVTSQRNRIIKNNTLIRLRTRVVLTKLCRA